MFRTGALGLGVVVWLACGVAPAPAASLTYDFTGTLDQPYNGSNQLSGSFTYATDLPLNTAVQPYPGWSYYTGVPADPTEPPLSLSFQFGGTSSSTLGPVDQAQVIVSHLASGDSFGIQERFTGNSSGPYWAELAMVNNTVNGHGTFSSSSPPASLDLGTFNQGADLVLSGTDSNGQYFSAVGRITSLTPIIDGQPGTPTTPPAPIPEPSSLLIFAALGAGACGLGRVRRQRAVDR